MGWANFKVRTAAVCIRVQLGASSPVYVVKLTFFGAYPQSRSRSGFVCVLAAFQSICRSDEMGSNTCPHIQKNRLLEKIWSVLLLFFMWENELFGLVWWMWLLKTLADNNWCDCRHGINTFSLAYWQKNLCTIIYFYSDWLHLLLDYPKMVIEAELDEAELSDSSSRRP